MIPNPNMFSPDKNVREQVKKDDMIAIVFMMMLVAFGFISISLILILN